MAYPTIDKTYGFKPVNRLDGLPYAGAIRQIPIAPAYATAILNGDTVQINTSGYIVAANTTDSGKIAGVLVGCSYVNSLSQPTFSQYYPAAVSTSTSSGSVGSKNIRKLSCVMMSAPVSARSRPAPPK